jgi:hypothetical protein
MQAGEATLQHVGRGGNNSEQMRVAWTRCVNDTPALLRLGMFESWVRQHRERNSL